MLKFGNELHAIGHGCTLMFLKTQVMKYNVRVLKITAIKYEEI